MTAELVKKVTFFGTYFGEFGYLNSSCIRKSIILMFLSSSRDCRNDSSIPGNLLNVFIHKLVHSALVNYARHFPHFSHSLVLSRLVQTGFYHVTFASRNCHVFRSDKINSRFCNKTQWQMFLLVSGRHVGAHPIEHQHRASIQIPINLG